ncbi:hypothetical protein [Mastigocoleus sp. MO_188.B34]|uniref:hypothetical protein n=1 Tax=Mastigocoleus sp. MO_188.B34 TaxID=3036635 RepID=UPI00261C0277|nr:hypothetical protein [Mastigocoleus sp. MO_188.B34]MDJ0697660.1 hypothetical protein [Mastigocoleus sp. MO_188.B34]
MGEEESFEGFTKIHKARFNIIKILRTRFKEIPEQVVETINGINEESVLQLLFTNSITVADFESFQQVLKSVMSGE